MIKVDIIQPIISIIIPTFNEEKLIGQNLSQFTPELKEKFKIEVIVSDGGSTDSTTDIAKKLCEKIIAPKPGEKQNISIGRNSGAKLVKGKTLYFMNADTLLENPDEFFQKTIEAFSDSKAVALACKVKVFPGEEKMTDRLFHYFYNNYVILLNFIGIGMGRGECHILRREIFDSVNGYNETLAAGEDFDLYKRIKKLGKIKFIKGLTVYESPRRYRKYGYFKVLADWTKNALFIFLGNKSASKEWEAVR